MDTLWKDTCHLYLYGQRRDQLAEANPQAIAMENEGEGKVTVVFVCHHNLINIHKYM